MSFSQKQNQFRNNPVWTGCGICGDPYDGVREHEAGGTFATGYISKTYTEGEVKRWEGEVVRVLIFRGGGGGSI